MSKRLMGIFFLSVLILCSGLKAQDKGKTLSLSLSDCIVKAMENNLGVAINVLDPELSDIALSRAREKFLPQLSFSFNKRNTEQASYSFLDAANQVSTINSSYSARVTQIVPTGGSFSMTVDGYKTDSNRSFQTINPRYGSTLTFNFSQPLLRNFGVKTTKREIIIARNNQNILPKAVRNKSYQHHLQR